MPEPGFALYDIWEGDSESTGETYLRHRIPGLIVTRRGTVLIYNEARYGARDDDKMDIFCQRSEDGGKSFGEPIYLARGNDIHKTVGNPVMLEDRNGRIHFFHTEDIGINGGRVLRYFSDDDGCTWSEPVDITQFTLPNYRNVIGLGPGHGICTREGMLIVPVWMVPKLYDAQVEAHAPSVIAMMYSKDDGEIWTMGDQLGSNLMIQSPNETAAAQLSDGRVYLSIRCKNAWRSKAISTSGYGDWVQYGPEKRLHDPQCFGSLAVYHRKDKPYTLLFANCESKVKRRNVVIKGSIDDGKTWTLRRVIDADRGGYVEINVDNQSGNIYVLYENDWGKTDHLAVFNYEWLEAGEEA